MIGAAGGLLLLRFPFRGRWLAQNSPANAVPSHGTHLYGTTFSIDFVAVDEKGHSAPRTWRSALATEAPEGFRGFGAAILAPVSGTVVETLDNQPDHEARRSPGSLFAYALTQSRRISAGPAAIAGNYVVIAPQPSGPFVLLAHLRAGSVRVAPGDRVDAGDTVGECGNSGNTTEPSVHVQATDSIDWGSARGLPIGFTGGGAAEDAWMPPNGAVFDAGP